MADITAEEIAAAALQPKSASNDSGSMTARDVAEMIEAAKWQKQNDGASKPNRGIRFTQLRSPGGA
jgi:hypothetical protein